MILALYLASKSENKRMLFFAGLAIGAAVLNRPQIALLVPVFTLFLLPAKSFQSFFWKGSLFAFGFLLIYGPWPVRNYVNHDKIILTQDLRGIPNWDEDVLAFLQYIYSVKAEWEPQMGQILQNEKVEWPAHAYTSQTDSIKLEKAVYNAQNCSRGFSYWKRYWQEPIKTECCTAETTQLFRELRASQIEANPLNFYLIIPLQNLRKALFKIKLTSPGSRVAAIAGSLLFSFRTVMLILGLLGAIVAIRQQKYQYLLPLLYMVFLYVALCFGTSPQFRNIEMRYFLPADVLMLIPAAFLFNLVWYKYYRKVNL
jgi:hypothetical protein